MKTKLKCSKSKGKGTEKRTKGPSQKKKVKLQQKKTAFREKLKVVHDVSKKQGQKSKKKKNKDSMAVFSSMKSLADTLEGFRSDDYNREALAMKIKNAKSSRQRDSIMKEERDRMSQVLHHPVFLSNPLEAVLGHLEATLPPAPRKDTVQSMKDSSMPQRKQR